MSLINTAGTAPDVPIVSWSATSDATMAHAFKDRGPGWMTAIGCDERWTVLMRPAPVDLPRCPTCALALRLAPESPLELQSSFGQ